MFIIPTPLIPLPSVSFQCKTFRLMLVRGKMFAGGGQPPPPAKEPPSPSRLTLKNERESELGEGRVRADWNSLLWIIWIYLINQCLLTPSWNCSCKREKHLVEYQQPFGGSSNGRTADSESVCGGSTPSPPASKMPARVFLFKAG